jgi:hypothetical protein
LLLYFCDDGFVRGKNIIVEKFFNGHPAVIRNLQMFDFSGSPATPVGKNGNVAPIVTVMDGFQ